MNKTEDTPKVWASLGQTINTGNFENIKVDIGISNIPIDCTDEFLNQQLNQANITLQKIVYNLAEQLIQRVKEIKP